MITTKNITRRIITGVGIILNGIFALIGFFEFYKVGIKKELESYPFGGEGPVPYYYKTAELYSKVNLIYGIAFLILFVIGIWNWKSNKINGMLIFGLTCLLILIQLIQAWMV